MLRVQSGGSTKRESALAPSASDSGALVDSLAALTFGGSGWEDEGQTDDDM